MSIFNNFKFKFAQAAKRVFLQHSHFAGRQQREKAKERQPFLTQRKRESKLCKLHIAYWAPVLFAVELKLCAAMQMQF